MILDKISNWHIYFKHEIFNQVFEDLKTITLGTPNGIHYKNDNYYFKVMSYDTKLDSDIIENHKKEVDIQILLSGKERIKIYDTDAVKTIRAYSSKDDCQFYTQIGEANSEIIIKPNYMGVFFSQDIHHPQFAVNGQIEHLKKIVIKVNEKFFS